MNNNDKNIEKFFKDIYTKPDISKEERANFQKLLKRENRKIIFLSWYSIGSISLLALILIWFCKSEFLMNKFNLGFRKTAIVFMFAILSVYLPLWVYLMQQQLLHHKKKQALERLVKNHMDSYHFSLMEQNKGKRCISWCCLGTFFFFALSIMVLGGIVVFYFLSKRLPTHIIAYFIYCLILNVVITISILIKNLKTPIENLPHRDNTRKVTFLIKIAIISLFMVIVITLFFITRLLLF